MPEMQLILLGEIRERKQSLSLSRYRDLELDTEAGRTAKKAMLEHESHLLAELGEVHTCPQ